MSLWLTINANHVTFLLISRSIEIKTEYANLQGLGGISIRGIEADNFEANKYPVLRKINQVFQEGPLRPMVHIPDNQLGNTEEEKAYESTVNKKGSFNESKPNASTTTERAKVEIKDKEQKVLKGSGEEKGSKTTTVTVPENFENTENKTAVTGRSPNTTTVKEGINGAKTTVENNTNASTTTERAKVEIKDKEQNVLKGSGEGKGSKTTNVVDDEKLETTESTTGRNSNKTNDQEGINGVNTAVENKLNEHTAEKIKDHEKTESTAPGEEKGSKSTIVAGHENFGNSENTTTVPGKKLN